MTAFAQLGMEKSAAKWDKLWRARKLTPDSLKRIFQHPDKTVLNPAAVSEINAASNASQSRGDAFMGKLKSRAFNDYAHATGGGVIMRDGNALTISAGAAKTPIYLSSFRRGDIAGDAMRKPYMPTSSPGKAIVHDIGETRTWDQHIPLNDAEFAALRNGSRGRVIPASFEAPQAGRADSMMGGSATRRPWGSGALSDASYSPSADVLRVPYTRGIPAGPDRNTALAVGAHEVGHRSVTQNPQLAGQIVDRLSALPTFRSVLQNKDGYRLRNMHEAAAQFMATRNPAVNRAARMATDLPTESMRLSNPAYLSAWRNDLSKFSPALSARLQSVLSHLSINYSSTAGAPNRVGGNLAGYLASIKALPARRMS